mmetsp:Transcript_1115/g.3268  ORF Transcript_1115/g.3268 Transcript_1115/m.3268 type:complete len:96 (-) Transcript_1115:166-453(-)
MPDSIATVGRASAVAVARTAAATRRPGAALGHNTVEVLAPRLRPRREQAAAATSAHETAAAPEEAAEAEAIEEGPGLALMVLLPCRDHCVCQAVA